MSTPSAPAEATEPGGHPRRSVPSQGRVLDTVPCRHPGFAVKVAGDVHRAGRCPCQKLPVSAWRPRLVSGTVTHSTAPSASGLNPARRMRCTSVDRPTAARAAVIIHVDRSDRAWCPTTGTSPIVLAAAAAINATMKTGKMRRMLTRRATDRSVAFFPCRPRTAARPGQTGMMARVRVSLTVTP